MPSATDTTAKPLAQMKPTPGVTPESEVHLFTPPVLFDDIDVVKLARLYPEEFKAGYEGARAAAMAAGKAAFEAAPHVIASQQEPVSGQEGMPPPSSPGVAPPARPPAAAAPTPPPPPPGTQWTPQQIAAWQAQQAARPPGA
ncbi:MAG TPA: hypothetical protein VGI78_27900 [Acetobacteraceae bacterium]|jgi:hypothetical protein